MGLFGSLLKIGVGLATGGVGGAALLAAKQFAPSVVRKFTGGGALPTLSRRAVGLGRRALAKRRAPLPGVMNGLEGVKAGSGGPSRSRRVQRAILRTNVKSPAEPQKAQPRFRAPKPVFLRPPRPTGAPRPPKQATLPRDVAAITRSFRRRAFEGEGSRAGPVQQARILTDPLTGPDIPDEPIQRLYQAKAEAAPINTRTRQGPVMRSRSQKIQQVASFLAPSNPCQWPARIDPRTGECKVFLGSEPGIDKRGSGPGTGMVLFEDAVTGAFGMPAIRPVLEQRLHSTCPKGMVLGEDELCYPKAVLRRDSRFRKWRPGTRPILTGGEVRAIATARRAITRGRDRMSGLGVTVKKKG